MPFYEYQCKACGHQVEVMQKFSDAPLKKCPNCGKNQLVKLMSAPVFRLKGSGWYETDFKSDKEGKRNLAAEKDEAPAADKDTGKSKEADKSDDKSKDAATDKSTDKPAEKKADADKPAAKDKARPAAARSAARKPARGKTSPAKKKKARR